MFESKLTSSAVMLKTMSTTYTIHLSSRSIWMIWYEVYPVVTETVRTKSKIMLIKTRIIFILRYWLFTNFRVVTISSYRADPPLVSVIIEAINEMKNYLRNFQSFAVPFQNSDSWTICVRTTMMIFIDLNQGEFERALTYW